MLTFINGLTAHRFVCKTCHVKRHLDLGQPLNCLEFDG
jgi:hypothetical protein